jgi:hypothetical protein
LSYAKSLYAVYKSVFVRRGRRRPHFTGGRSLEAVKNVTVYRIRTLYTPKQGLFRLSALGSRKPAHFLQPLRGDKVTRCGDTLLRNAGDAGNAAIVMALGAHQRVDVPAQSHRAGVRRVEQSNTSASSEGRSIERPCVAKHCQ